MPEERGMSARIVKLKEIEKYGFRLDDDEDPESIAMIAGEKFVASWAAKNRPFDDRFINMLVNKAYEAGVTDGRKANQKEIKKALGIYQQGQ
jgi:hypothetical protein